MLADMLTGTWVGLTEPTWIGMANPAWVAARGQLCNVHQTGMVIGAHTRFRDSGCPTKCGRLRLCEKYCALYPANVKRDWDALVWAYIACQRCSRIGPKSSVYRRTKRYVLQGMYYKGCKVL